MPTIKRFEDIQAWQKAREITANIYQITRDSEFSRDFGLRDQIRRASVSTMSNIAEGFARKSDRDFAHFLIFLEVRLLRFNRTFTSLQTRSI